MTIAEVAGSCYELRPLGLDDKVTLYRVYTRELDGELCIE